MTKVVILLTLPEEVRNQYRARLLATFPSLDIVIADHHSKAVPLMGDADVLITFGPMMADAVVANARKLRWIQALGTGVDNLVDLPSLPKGVVVTNTHGIHGAPLSEAAFAGMLLLSRRMHRSVRAQDRRLWDRWPSTLLYDKTVGILGVGAIAEDRVPSTKEPDPYMHIFLDAGGGSILAFFELPNSPPMGRDEWIGVGIDLARVR